MTLRAKSGRKRSLYREFGTYLPWGSFVILAICGWEDLKILRDVNPGVERWYSGALAFSCWNKVPRVDFSTNPIVCGYYQRQSVPGTFDDNWSSYQRQLSERDVLIGVDYYGFAPRSRSFVPIDLMIAYNDVLLAGGVVVIKAHRNGTDSVIAVARSGSP